MDGLRITKFDDTIIVRDVLMTTKDIMTSKDKEEPIVSYYYIAKKIKIKWDIICIIENNGNIHMKPYNDKPIDVYLSNMIIHYKHLLNNNY